MAYQGYCAHCGSYDMVAGQNMFQCLHCGEHTHHLGHAVPSLADRQSPSTKES